MRKVERQMIDAIRYCRSDVDGTIWKCGNTVASQWHEGIHGTIGYRRLIEVRLYSTVIATWEPAYWRQTLVLDHGGYTTVTTKSRLNAICELLFGRQLISQRDYTWFVDDVPWVDRRFVFSEHFVSLAREAA